MSVLKIHIPNRAPGKKGRCPECFDIFDKARSDQIFCCETHKRSFHRRREARAVALYDDAIEWRRKREKGGFTRFCQLLDRDLAEDKERRQIYKDARAAAGRQTKKKDG